MTIHVIWLLSFIYVSSYFSVLLHELAHCVALKLMKIPVDSIIIGFGTCGITIGNKVHCSFIPLGGCVEFRSDLLLDTSKIKKALICFSGVIINGIISAIFAIVMVFHYSLWAQFIMMFNLLICMLNSVPFIKGNDYSAFIECIGKNEK